MAFPSTIGTVPTTLEAGWEQARALAATVKQQAQGMVAGAGGNGVYANQILSAYAFFQSAIATFNTIAGIAGIAAYAQAQIGSSTEDIASDFEAMVNAIQAAVTWINGNFPHDASNPPNLLFAQFSSTGVIQYTLFTPAELAGLVTVLNALIATIN